MDVTPRELRDLEIREAFRGYNREDVDDLLERAAKTIEAANDRIRQLTDQAQAGSADTGKTRELEETLQRTLILAQRTADQAVAEAQEQSKTMVEEAERRARSITTEAESQAKRAAETERQRLESQILDLGSRREALLADVEALEQFDADYRTRLREAIESDLEWLTKRSAVPVAPRPAIHDVAIPTLSKSAPARDAVPAAPATPAADVPGAPAEEPPESSPASPAPSSGRWTPPPGDDSTGTAAKPNVFAPPSAPNAAPTAPTAPAPSDSAPRNPTRRGSAPEASGKPALFESTAPVESQVLDDDAFFATLREAVRDDAPLGPRDDDAKPASKPFEPEDDSTRFGSVFKRRR